jgi:predicted DNA-binding transcriptional regulator AlpA
VLFACIHSNLRTVMNESLTLLRVRDVASKLAVDVRQVWKLVADGRFPAPLKISRSSRWRSADVDAWIAGLDSKPDGRGDTTP